MKNRKKWCFYTFIIVTGLCLFFLNSIQLDRIKKLNKSLSQYFYLSCPNGNALQISQCGNLKFEYNLYKYSSDLYDYSGVRSYESETNILGKTIFYNSEILSGSDVNYETDFPHCVLSINDSVDTQYFYYPSFEDSMIDKVRSNGGKIYISLKSPIEYKDAIGLIGDFERYGTITWLWVDTYSNINMDNNPITIQKPADIDQLPVFGIPLYYNGQKVDNPIAIFLNIFNDLPAKDMDPIVQIIRNVKLGINDTLDSINEKDIKILGFVLLPLDEVDRNLIFDEINDMDYVKSCK